MTDLRPPTCADCGVLQTNTNSSRRTSGPTFRSLCRACESLAAQARYRARRERQRAAKEGTTP
ncbi:hypothetical protein SEA_OBLADI_68 [Gordonia phage ObLaDi]|uniref:HNH endonuclease n=1 Tax=Gordonia phage ObLaDi TaxID=2978487 RepID=A0A977PS70_9CAUD|nr:hypothetical protein SEA_OBLADI_68 [Gordonia phage ObLaDi]